MNLLRSASSKLVALVGLVAATGIAQTPKKPLMAWSSWNCYYEDITEAKIIEPKPAHTTRRLRA